MSGPASLEEGLAHHRAGRLEEAARLYQRVLDRDPRHPEALHLLGVTAHQRGAHARAVELISAALAADPGHAAAHGNLGLVHAARGELAAAERCFRRAAELDDSDPTHHANLAYALLGRLRPGEAAEAFARALALAPGAGPAVAELHRGLARAELERKRADRAIPELRRALAIVPGDRDSLRLLGIAAGRAGEPDEARRCLGRLLADGEDAEVLAELAVVECEAGDAAAAEELARRALAADPECAAAHVALARAALEQRRFAAAEAAARAAMALDPTDDAAPGWLGFALFNQGRLAEASDAFLAPVRRLRAPGSRHGDDHPTFARMSLTKLEQDIGQLEYLLAHERVDAGKAAVLEAYRAFAREHAAGVGRTTLLDVPRDHPVAPHYNRLLVDAPEPAIPGGALNPDLDFGAIAEAFHASRLGYVQVDDLLNRAALAALQRYSLEASIWFEMKFHSEVGSSLCNGYCCPLLLQIAADIERALPGIFAPHPFTTCWTYKYFQDETDGHIHADVGAASINLWVTPDEANLEPDSGGLLIWNKTLPKRLFRASGEEQMKASLALVAEPDAEPGYVPYRCNRAMIFRSNVLHKTERVKFKPGYADRRVSVTFLYGRPE